MKVTRSNLEEFIYLKAKYQLYGYRAKRIYDHIRMGFSAVIFPFK